MRVLDLDVLRPEKRMIRIGGKDIDVSFIPCGITFDIDSIVQELSGIDQQKILLNGEETKRAFDLSVKLCSVFCSRKFPELDEEWFNNNTDARQIKEFSSAIKDALVRAYSIGVDNPKNQKAVKRKQT
jgi:hypothetical protein